MKRTVYGQVLPFTWEPFTKLQSASLIVRYVHKGSRRKAVDSRS